MRVRLASLDWLVEKRPLFLQGRKKVDGIPVIGQEAPDHEAVVRKTDNKVLGVVGKRQYEPIQNGEAMAFLDALVGEGLAMFHTAGSMFGGRRIFVTCKLPDSIQVGPDKIDKYLALCMGHDGRLALHIKWTGIRVVCWNTCSAAFNIWGGKVKATDAVSIRHTKGWKNRVDEVRKVLDLTDVYYQRLDECFNKLRKQRMSAIQIKNFATKLFPSDAVDDDGNPQIPAQTEKRRAAIKLLFDKGHGNDVKGVKGTRWAAYNAVTQYVDWHRPTKNVTADDYGEKDVRLHSIVWGGGATLKKRALQLLTA